MRRALILSALALLVASAALAQDATFQNDHYAVVLSKANGGLLQSLKAKPSGDDLSQGMMIYTDYGVFDTRGFVGTGAASAEVFKVKRTDTGMTVHTEGKLVGAPARGKPPVHYRADFTFDQSPTIHVAVAVQPGADNSDVRGFLACAWQIPTMASYRVRTVEGLWRHLYRKGEEKAGRSYNGWPPMAPERPLLDFETVRGAELSITKMKWSGVPTFTGPCIQGRMLFLCFLDGDARDLKAGKWSELSFDLQVSAAPR